MIRITTSESKRLAKMGVPYGSEGIHHTYSNHNKSYYLTESKHNMKLLNEIRQATK